MVNEGASQRAMLNDLALELAEKSPLSDLPYLLLWPLPYRHSMNCYYSNLIEG